MAQFYGTVQGNRGQATRLGAKSSGLTTESAGWQGCIETRVWYDEDKERDVFRVLMKPWGNSSGERVVLAEGILDASIEDPFIVPAVFA